MKEGLKKKIRRIYCLDVSFLRSDLWTKQKANKNAEAFKN